MKMSYEGACDIAPELKVERFCYDLTDAEYSGNIMQSYVALNYRSEESRLKLKGILKNIHFLNMEIF